MAEDANPEGEPLLRIMRGSPDDAELAALTAVVAGLRARATHDGGRRRTTVWSDPRGRVRRPIAHGPGAWHSSGLPI